MAHKKQKPLPNTHPRQKILNELKRIKEEGIKFPEHNPLPKKRTEMKKAERKTLGLLKYKEKQRNQPKSSNMFSAWENKDRYSYRKIE
jgi:hypothetical protein